MDERVCAACGQTLPELAMEDKPIEDREFGGWDFNPYSSPGNCGLELVATLEDNEPWQFDIIAFWKDKLSGRYFMAHDSGCSCPSPFEDVRSVSDLTEVSTLSDVLEFTYGQRYLVDRMRPSEVGDFVTRCVMVNE